VVLVSRKHSSSALPSISVHDHRAAPDLQPGDACCTSQASTMLNAAACVCCCCRAMSVSPTTPIRGTRWIGRSMMSCRLVRPGLLSPAALCDKPLASPSEGTNRIVVLRGSCREAVCMGWCACDLVAVGYPSCVLQDLPSAGASQCEHVASPPPLDTLAQQH
jgi:hypothetical protein